MRRIIASLDIGSSTLKLLIGEIVKKRVNILSCVETPSRGIKNGFIVNIESAIESLKEIFQKSEEMLGLKVNKVIVSVSSLGLECFMTEGSVMINNEDKVITYEHLNNALDLSIKDKISPNMVIVSIMPTHFIINDIDKVSNPIKMIADKLTVRSVVGIIPQKNVTTIIGCLSRIGVKVIDVTIGAMGDYCEFKSEETQASVGSIINIGASKTTVSIFNKGILTASEELNIGGNNIDSDIGYVYKVNKNDAVYLKENLSLAHKDMAQANESMNINNKNNELIKINQYDISEISMQRLEEILNLTKKQINLLTKKEISYIIVTGGVTEFVDFSLILDEVFNHKARIGNVNEIGIRNNKYVTAIGLIKYYNNKLKLRNNDFSIFNLEEQEELGGMQKKVSIADNSLLGKLFGYFFDN